MGTVYKAHDIHLDRSVALKTLPGESVANPERKRRFALEAKAASALNYPNIITIYDIDVADGVDFIAMEYVAGHTLADMIPSDGMEPARAIQFAAQIADALATAHQSGIVHRDPPRRLSEAGILEDPVRQRRKAAFLGRGDRRVSRHHRPAWPLHLGRRHLSDGR
jgi:serine/threonine protein kinase